MKLDKSIARNVTKMTIHTSADTSDVKLRDTQDFFYKQLRILSRTRVA